MIRTAYKLTSLLLFSLLWFGLTVSGIGQEATIAFTSTNPADGGVGGSTTCVNNGWLSLNYADCVPVQSPSPLAAVTGANLYFIGRPPSGGWTGGTHSYGGTIYLTNISTSDWSSPAIMSQFIIWRTGLTSLDFRGATIYHEAGTDITFTIEDRGNTARQTVVVPSATPTSFSISGTFGFSNIDFFPSSNTNFGVTDFVFADTPFPVTWGGISAELKEDAVVLDWSTEIESNNNYFVVERSQDGETFDALTRLTGAGNSSTPTSYQYIDGTFPGGNAIYRIRQVDFDGNSSLSPVVEISLETANVNIFPNPATDQLLIEANFEMNGALYTLQGEPVKIVEKGTRTIPVGDLTPGLYLLELKGENSTRYVQKIMIK